MSHPPMEVYSSEDARRQAEYRRAQISQTLDVLGDKISRTVTQAERQINRPLNLIRENPFLAVGAGVAVGLAFALLQKRSHRRPAQLAHELDLAYKAGIRDARENRAPRHPEYWRAYDAPPAKQGLINVQRLLLDLSAPLVRAVGGGLIEHFVHRLRR